MDGALNEDTLETGSGGSPSPDATQSTAGNDGWDPNANKPYMRQLGKQYWGDQRLVGFDSLNGLVDAYLESTKPKAPERYGAQGITDELSKAFHEMDLSDESATKVMGLIESAKPAKVDVEKVLRERHGDGYEAFRSNADKAIEAFSDDGLKELADEYGLSSNPAFMEYMAKIGKEVGDDFHDGRIESRTKPKTNVFMEFAKKSIGAR